MVALTRQSATADALSRLASTLDTLEFGSHATPIATERDRLVGTIRSFLIPRALDPDAPIKVVIAGPTGSGKSTVLNSLVGTEVSATGVRRPTTTTPVVVASPEHITDHEVVGGVSCLTIAFDDPALSGLVLVDSPDIDSTSTHHRATAEQLIDSADVVVFVTSALRYADLVPWQVLRRAQSRGAPVINVLNRVESQSSGAPMDFRSKLAAEGLGNDIITIPEHHLLERAQLIPRQSIQRLHARLGDVMANRDELASDVFLKVLSSTMSQVIGMTDEVVGIRDEIDSLENRWSASLASRVPGLSLEGVADRISPPAPRRNSRSALRRWKKKSLTASPEAAETVVIDRLIAVVVADLRSWLVESGDQLRRHALDSVPVVQALLPAAQSAAEGWVDFVSRIAVDFDPRHAWLGESILIEAACRDDFTPGVAALFDASGPVLVDRARRELVKRLEVVFHHAARVLADTLRDRYSDPDETELRAAVGAVTASVAALHA